MHVALNLVFLVPGETGGMEVAARALIPELVAAAPGVRFTAIVNREAAGEDLGVDRIVLPVHARQRVEWVRAEQAMVPRAARRAGATLVHSPGGTAPGWGPHARVVTIHDLHYRTVPEAHFGLLALGMRAVVPLAARTAHRVITVSEHSKGDIVRLLGVRSDRVDVVPNGLGRRPDLAPTPEEDLRARLDLGARPVLLALSAKRPHKNLTGLLDALALIPRERRPVAVLPGYPTPHEAELRARAAALGVAGDVRFPGWTADADVEGLFALADGFVHPAFSEGFGLPVLEAMARGVPVACSDRTALSEVAGDAALLFDPAEPAQIAAAIERLPSERDRLAAAGRDRAARFTWRAAAEGTLASYELASRQRKSSRRLFRS